MQVVLVAGGAGFIGSHLCEALLQKGYKVICVDNLITGSKKNIQDLFSSPHFTFIEHDVIKPLSFVKQLNIEQISYIFHLASPASPNTRSKISYHALPMETMMVNTVGTHRLLDLADMHKARFLFTSTSEIYGDPLVHPQSEDYRGNVSTTGPRSIYDESKRFGETLTSFFFHKKSLNTRIARIFNTYGPHMQREDGRMIVSFTIQALSNNPLTVFGDGTQTRSLCYVSDMVEGLLKLMFSENAAGEVVNLGSMQEHSVLEYAKIIIELTHSKSKIEFLGKLPEDDPKRRRPDISKAQKLLGWNPKISLENGLEKTIEYFKRI